MIGRRAAVSWDEARLIAYEAVAPLPPVGVALDGGLGALGAILASPLVALVPLPPAACSAMDGYAVAGAGPWALVDGGAALAPGQAAPVVTGAPVPQGTTAVLPVEHAEVRGFDAAGPGRTAGEERQRDETDPRRTAGEVRARGEIDPGRAPAVRPSGPAVLHGELQPGRHIRPAGEECAAGETVLPAGGPVTPAVLGLAAALGHDEVRVHPLPAVAALVTGDELVHSGLPGPGRTRDAIGPMLPGLVAAVGGRWCGATRIPDRLDAFLAAVDGAAADVVLLSGASGKGPADHLRTVLRELGADLLVDGVACRPGHPQTLARLPDGRVLVGLPGNPFAALTAFLTLAAPAVAALGGAPLPELPKVPARGFQPHDHVHRVVPARVTSGVAEPLDHGGPAMLRGVAAADRLAVVAPGSGDTVRLLDPGGASWAG